MKILIVEDDIGISELISQKIIESDQTVEIINSGAEAVEYLKKEIPDLMILDYGLPDYNGQELIARLKEENIEIPPFIVSTGRGDERIAVEMMKLGAKDYVVKDINFLVMIPEVVRRVIKEIENEFARTKAEDQKKIALEALRISERQYRTLFEDSTDAIFVVEIPSGRYLDANKSALKLAGRTLEELKLLKISDITPYGSKERLQKSTKVNESLDFGEVIYVQPNGTERIALLSVIPLDEYTVYGIAHDITGRKKAEAALRESEELFRRAFLTSPDAININRLDDGMYVNINNGFTKITGFSKEDVEGKTSLELNVWANPAEREKLVKGLMEDGIVENLESEFQMKDGSIATGLMSATIISIKGVPHVLSITRDISERKKAEKELENYKSHLEDMIEERTEELREINILLQKEIELRKQNEEKVITALKKKKN